MEFVYFKKRDWTWPGDRYTYAQLIEGENLCKLKMSRAAPSAAYRRELERFCEQHNVTMPKPGKSITFPMVGYY